MKKNPLLTIALFEFRENIRNKWLMVYGTGFFLFSLMILYLGATDPLQAAASLLNLVLLLVPLFSLVFGSISFTDSLPFQEILVALPISRREIYLGKWLGLGLGLSLSFLIGMGMGAFFQLNAAESGFASYFLLLLLGVLLTFVFLSIAFWISNIIRRRELIFGVILLGWFYFFVLYDVLVLGLSVFFGDYPLEKLLLVLVSLNPIDLARVLLLLQIDLSAMMGYSGALFQKYLGNTMGIWVGSALLTLWIIIPTFFGYRTFKRKDL